MKLLRKKLLIDFSKSYSDVRSQLNIWKLEIEDAKWETPNDIKKRYQRASFLHNNIVVFNIKGNKYRIAVKVNYKNQIVLLKNIGTHAEYSKWEL